jgi:hypothetical protein
MYQDLQLEKRHVAKDGAGIPAIQILRATAFNSQMATGLVVGTFFLRVGDCTGLLGATMAGITEGE